MDANTKREKVTLDGRGRITIPQRLRNRLQLSEGDDLNIVFKDDKIHLRLNKPLFEPIAAGKSEWETETFVNAGEALFGDSEDNDSG